MRLAALYSGGKDSTFAIYKAVGGGHDVVCLITILPDRDDSLFFHYPNARLTAHQAECMGIPLVTASARCGSRDEELGALERAVSDAARRFAFDGLVTGGIASRFQTDNFEMICRKLGLKYYAPSWGADQARYMHDLLANDFVIMITGVSAAGLDQSWLGRIIDVQALHELEALSRKYGFSIAFEGGEAETFVLDCPIFRKRIEVRDARKHWDGVRGYFEILEASLVGKEEKIVGS